MKSTVYDKAKYNIDFDKERFTRFYNQVYKNQKY